MINIGRDKIKIALNSLKRYVDIRSDIEDLIYDMCYKDQRLYQVLISCRDVTYMLYKRIDEANKQGNAALVYDNTSGRGIGKSWLNFLIAYLILKSRGINDQWKERIVFKVGDEIINTPSRWTEGIKLIANNLETIENGGEWCLLQDELSSEWGKGRVIQSNSQKDAINELRKLGTSLAFASPSKDDSKLYDFRLFTIGYNEKTRVMAAILYFHRAQGIIFLKMPTEVFYFLKQEYDIDAKKHVLEKAKNGFYTETIPVGDEQESSMIQNNEDLQNHYIFDGDNFQLLRNLFRDYWISTHDVTEPYARILTSYFLWSKTLYYSNSKKRINPDQITIDKLPIKSISSIWVDEVGVNSLSQAKHNYSDKYREYEFKLTTHHQEEIGETYAKIVLENAIEHLNPPVAGVSVEKQFRDDSIIKGGKPYDAAIINNNLKNSSCVVALNHKLLTSNKRISSTQLDDSWGRSSHSFQVLWYTHTRPFREIYYIKETKKGSKKEGLPSEKEGLGAQWEKVTWDQLIERISEVIK